MTRHLAALLALVGVAASPAPALAEKRAPAATSKAESGADEDFREGYRLFSKKKHLDACARLYAFLSQRSSNDENYDWARFFLGISLYELGFSHAAADTLSELVARKPNVRIVSYSLEVLEDITRTKPFDWETIVLNGLVDQDFGFVDGDLADFVHYYQGLYDWRHGYLEWGGSHFRAIRKGSYYHGLYLFQKALHHVAFVVDGQLHGHAGQFLESPGWFRQKLLAAFQVGSDDLVAVQSIKGEHHHDGEIGDQQRPVEKVAFDI